MGQSTTGSAEVDWDIGHLLLVISVSVYQEVAHLSIQNYVGEGGWWFRPGLRSGDLAQRRIR